MVSKSLGIIVKSTGDIVEAVGDWTKRNKLCGLCGDCNADPSDDWAIGPNRTCAGGYDNFPSAGTIVSGIFL